MVKIFKCLVSIKFCFIKNIKRRKHVNTLGFMIGNLSLAEPWWLLAAALHHTEGGKMVPGAATNYPSPLRGNGGVMEG